MLRIVIIRRMSWVLVLLVMGFNQGISGEVWKALSFVILNIMSILDVMNNEV
jgi:hypothetical protein